MGQDAHQVEMQVPLVRNEVRVAVVVALLAVTLISAMWGWDNSINAPRFERPEWTGAQIHRAWRAEHPPVVRRYGRVYRPTLAERIQTRRDYEAFAQALPPRWPRPLPPHPLVISGLSALTAGMFWVWFAPLRIRLRVNGLWLGRRFVQADDLRECRVSMLFGVPRLVVVTRSRTIRTVPLRMSKWELQDLCDDVRGLVLLGDARAEAERLRASLHPRMMALSAASARPAVLPPADDHRRTVPGPV